MEKNEEQIQEEIKVGDYLYNIVYWQSFPNKSEREIRKVKIKKINPKSYSLVYWGWKINKSEIGKSWFTSMREVLESTLERHKEELECSKENVKIFEKECRYLKKKINELKQEGRNSSQH